MNCKILLIFVLLLNVYSGSANAVECTDKQECFPETSSTWHLFEKEKTIKKLSIRVRSGEELFLKKIDSHSLRKSLRSQFKKSAELSLLECEIVGGTSKAGAHWPGVWSGECQISYMERHLGDLKDAGECLKKADSDAGQCVSSFFQTVPKN